jgi:hypothetical protein
MMGKARGDGVTGDAAAAPAPINQANKVVTTTPYFIESSLAAALRLRDRLVRRLVQGACRTRRMEQAFATRRFTGAYG